MNKCQYYNQGKCVIASHLANGIDCFVNERECAACSMSINPRQENKVTASIAAAHLYKEKTDLPQNLIKTLNWRKKKIIKDDLFSDNQKLEGPGTELKKLLSWIVKPFPTCSCHEKIKKMNEWGPDGCEQNIEEILDWLHESAKDAGIPYVRFAVRLMVQQAVRNARDAKTV